MARNMTLLIALLFMAILPCTAQCNLYNAISSFEKDGINWHLKDRLPLSPEKKESIKRAFIGLKQCADDSLTSTDKRTRENAAFLLQQLHKYDNEWQLNAFPEKSKRNKNTTTHGRKRQYK